MKAYPAGSSWERGLPARVDNLRSGAHRGLEARAPRRIVSSTRDPFMRRGGRPDHWVSGSNPGERGGGETAGRAPRPGPLLRAPSRADVRVPCQSLRRLQTVGWRTCPSRPSTTLGTRRKALPGGRAFKGWWVTRRAATRRPPYLEGASFRYDDVSSSAAISSSGSGSRIGAGAWSAISNSTDASPAVTEPAMSQLCHGR